MSKDMLKGLIELVPEKDIDLLYQVIVKFIPTVPPEPEEIKAMEEGRADRKKNGTISHNEVNWD